MQSYATKISLPGTAKSLYFLSSFGKNDGSSALLYTLHRQKDSISALLTYIMEEFLCSPVHSKKNEA